MAQWARRGRRRRSRGWPVSMYFYSEVADDGQASAGPVAPAVEEGETGKGGDGETRREGEVDAPAVESGAAGVV